MKNRKRILRNLIFVFLITMVIVAIFKLLPETKAEESNIRTLKVTYKSGSGVGNDVVVNHQIYGKQTQGANDYTDNKIIFHENGDGIIDYDGGTLEYAVGGEKQTYEKVLTGWKLISVTKNGVKLTNFVEPEKQNYANPDDANKDIGTVYAQKGWYIVPNGVTEIEVEAVYGRAIYIRSPYDKMYYDEYHVFYYGENLDENGNVIETTINGGVAVEKSSDGNFGTCEEDAVSTLKRAYELVNANSNLTIYDTIFLLCGDLYEINYTSDGSAYATGQEGTYMNYSSGIWGYNTSNKKPVTISSKCGNFYQLYLCTKVWDFEIYSSLRLDNIMIGNLPISILRDIHQNSTTVNTYIIARQMNMISSNSILEITENLKSIQQGIIRFINAQNIKIGGGSWEVYDNYEMRDVTFSNKGRIIISGYANIKRLILAQYTNNGIYHIQNNSRSIVITGGKINEGVYGTGIAEGSNIGGDVNMFISGGYVTNLYGASCGSVMPYDNEAGSINIKIYGGKFDNIYGAGEHYTSQVSGNVNIDIKNAEIINNIYGGGIGGKVLGSVKLDIDNCKIGGLVYGGGLGVTDLLNTVVIKVSDNDYDIAVQKFNEQAENLGTYKWNQKPLNFPKYNSDDKEIIRRICHETNFSNNYYYTREVIYKSMFTLAEINNVNITIKNSTIEGDVYGGGAIAVIENNVDVNIDNSTIRGNIYGGGAGDIEPEKVLLYAPVEGNYNQLAESNSNSTSRDNNREIGSFSWIGDEGIKDYFNGVYDGKTEMDGVKGVIWNLDGTKTSFSELTGEARRIADKYGEQQLIYSENCGRLGEVGGNIKLTVKNSTVSQTSYICGGGKAGKVKSNIEVNIDGVSKFETLYGGGYQGDVNGKTDVIVSSADISNLYGGGYSGIVNGIATTIINSGNIGKLYGGGYSGSVGSTVVNINRGTFDEIFGGGNLGVVGSSGNLGTTNVTVGKIDNVESNSVVVNGLVYGGGRGKITNTETQTSNEITVYGNSNVKIQGINTQVENYGSTKLGLVSGNIDVTFEDYWTGNATSPYKRMNGIDKATNVNFVRSYVLLENRAVGGALEGIKSIGNLSIPL